MLGSVQRVEQNAENTINKLKVAEKTLKLGKVFALSLFFLAHALPVKTLKNT
jgi:hypothetical protein